MVLFRVTLFEFGSVARGVRLDGEGVRGRVLVCVSIIVECVSSIMDAASKMVDGLSSTCAAPCGSVVRAPWSARRAQRAVRGVRSARAIPPSTRTPARTIRVVKASPSSTTPPTAAIGGTLSCTIAARVALSRGSAAYHAA